jgi:hypothetical protein
MFVFNSSCGIMKGLVGPIKNKISGLIFEEKGNSGADALSVSVLIPF